MWAGRAGGSDYWTGCEGRPGPLQCSREEERGSRQDCKPHTMALTINCLLGCTTVRCHQQIKRFHSQQISQRMTLNYCKVAIPPTAALLLTAQSAAVPADNENIGNCIVLANSRALQSVLSPIFLWNIPLEYSLRCLTIHCNILLYFRRFASVRRRKGHPSFRLV